MSLDEPGPVMGTSSERGRVVHTVRNLVLVIPVLAIALAAAGLSLGPPIGWSLAASPASAPIPDEADALASVVVPAAPAATPPRAQDERPIIDVAPAPPSAARLIAGPVRRLVDTRDRAPIEDGENGVTEDEADLTLPDPGPSVTGLVLSVSLLGAERAGTVTVDGPYGSIDAVTVPGPGATTTTGLVVVPGAAPSRLINPTGGDLVVDLVGRHVASGPSSDGRLVTVDPVRLTRLVTATDGREAQVPLDGVEGLDGASAAVVAITADVGADGGRIGLGPAPDRLDQMLMWGPPTTADRQRSGVLLVTPGADGRFALRYDGGSVLDVDLIGYVTGPGAPVDVEGLFVPATTVATIDRVFVAGTTVVGPAAPGTAQAIVGLRAAAGAPAGPRPAALADDLTIASGRTVGTVLPVGPDADGRPGVLVTSATELEARLQVMGHLLGPSG